MLVPSFNTHYSYRVEQWGGLVCITAAGVHGLHAEREVKGEFNFHKIPFHYEPG
jgi:hypothetical protein